MINSANILMVSFEEAKKLTAIALDLIMKEEIVGDQMYGWLFLNFLLREKEVQMRNEGLLLE